MSAQATCETVISVTIKAHIHLLHGDHTLMTIFGSLLSERNGGIVERGYILPDKQRELNPSLEASEIESH